MILHSLAIKVYFLAKNIFEIASANITFHTPINLDIGLFKHQWLYIVPSWDIQGRELVSIRRYPNEGQYSPISVQ